MKRFFSGILILSFTFVSMYAQQSSRRAPVDDTKNAPTVSVRAQNMYGNAEVNTDNVIWMREIYRELDLTNEKNGPLYFPVMPVGDRMNLFTLIFNTLSDGKIPAYEFLDGREVFTDQYKIDFKKDILDKHGIYYEQKFSQSSKNPVYKIDETDIPSNEVLKFYIKEMWYFDQANSTFDSKVLSLCPVLVRRGDYGSEAVREPMFWIVYDDVRPYLSQVRVMTSNYNNIANSTYDDYFRRRAYKGDIYKVTNLANLMLAQYCATDSLVQLEQQRLEDEIAAFEKRLWEQPDWQLNMLRNKKNLSKSERALLRKLEADENNETDTTTQAASSEKKSVKSSAKASKQPAAKTPKATKAPKAQSAPAKSVRRR